MHTYNPCTEEVEIGGFLEFVGQPGQVPGQARTSRRKMVVLDERVTLRDCSLAFRMPAHAQKARKALRREGSGPVLLLAEMTEEWRSRKVQEESELWVAVVMVLQLNLRLCACSRLYT